jgi:hypothetical protein
MYQQVPEKAYRPQQVGRYQHGAGAETIYQRPLRGNRGQAQAGGQSQSQAHYGKRKADDLMKVQHGERIEKACSQRIDEVGRPIRPQARPEARKPSTEEERESFDSGQRNRR